MKQTIRHRVHLHVFLFVSALFVACITGALYVAHIQMRHARAAWPKAPARIRAERVQVTQVYSEHPQAEVFYQGEVLAAYVVNGSNMERWIPALGASTDKLGLQHDLQALAEKSCYAQWNPDFADEVTLIC